MIKRSISAIACLALILSFLPFLTPTASAAVPDQSALRVSAGQDYYLAILGDNTLWGWGYDGGIHLGQLYAGAGHEIIPKPTKIMDNVKEAQAGYRTSLALKTDNTLWAWGGNMPSTGEERLTYALKPEKIMDNVVSFSSGDDFVVVVKNDGTLWGWGDNIAAKLDPGIYIKDWNSPDTVAKPVAKPMKLMDGVQKVVAGGACFYALKKDGTLLGFNGTVSGSSKVKIGNLQYYALSTGVKDVFNGVSTVYFLKTDDSLWGIGKKVYEDINKYDENKANLYDRTPIKVMDGVKAAAVNDSLPSLALTKNGRLVAWGIGSVVDVMFTKNGIDMNTFMDYKSVELMQNVSQISAGLSAYLVAKNDGTVWMWGINIMDSLSGGAKSMMGTKDFLQLDFSDTQSRLFMSGTQKGKLLSTWLKEKTTAGEIPAYDANFKANWVGGWDQTLVPGMTIKKHGNQYYCYDMWNDLTFVATAQGNKLNGRMLDSIFELTMKSDGKSFTGMFFDNSAPEAQMWNGVRKK